MKIGDEIYVHGYVDEIRKDVIIIRNDGGYFGTILREVGLFGVEPTDEPKVVMPKKCKGCDSASKIIEAYSRGFEDGAEAMRDLPKTDCPWK